MKKNKKVIIAGKERLFYTFTHQDCKDKSAQWMRYSEDAVRRFIDPLRDKEEMLDQIATVIIWVLSVLIIKTVIGG